LALVQLGTTAHAEHVDPAVAVRPRTGLLLGRSGLSQYRRGVVYALGAGVALGTLGPLSNVAFAAGMGSSTFAAVRATLGAVALLVFIRATRHPTVPLTQLRRREVVMLGATAAAQAGLSLSLFAAFAEMSVALVLAAYFCYPLLVAAASIALRRERLTATRAVALMLALGGLAAVFLADPVADGAVSILGIGLAVVAAGFQATYLVVSRASFTRVPSEQAGGLILAGAAGLTWLVALPVDGASGALHAWTTSPSAWIAVCVAGVLGAALAKVFLLRAVRRLGGTRTSVLLLFEPLVAVVLAGVMLGQGLTPGQILGGVAVLAAALLAQRPAKGLRTAA
jgi:drug/metabolite transporter (DMT)-like permease